MNFVDKLGVFVKKYLSLLVLIGAAISYINPNIFIGIVPYFNYILGFIMFGMGMTLTKDDFILILKKPKDVILGLLIQMVTMSIGAFIVVKLLGLKGDVAVGLILLGACPGGTTSNVMSFIAKADVALSVTYTSIFTFLAPIVTPALIYLFAGTYVQVDGVGMFISISQVVLIPIILGVIANTLFAKVAAKCVRVLPSVSGLAMVVLVAGIVAANASKLNASVVIVALGVIIHNIWGYLCGYFGGKAVGFKERKRRTLSIETGMKNATLATVLAAAHFAPEAAIAPAIAGIWHAFSVSVLANYWGNKEITDEDDEEVKESLE